jgi:hypothetical protein
MDLADELRKLAELRQAGHLTDQEFVDAKRRLLAETGAQSPQVTPPPPLPQQSPQLKKSGGLRGCVIVACVLFGVVLLLSIIGRNATPRASHPTSPVASATSAPSIASATPATAPAAVATPTPEPKATPTPEPTATPRQLLSIGEVGELRSDASNDSRPVYVCKTKEVFEQWMKAAAADDTEGWMTLLRSGRMFPVKQGTKVRKIDIQKKGGFFLGYFLDEVRILEGAYKDWSGVVDPDYVRPLQSVKPQSESETKSELSPSPQMEPKVPNITGPDANDQRLTKFTNQKYGCAILVPLDVFPDPPQQADDEHTKFVSTDGTTTLELVVDQNPQKRAVAEVYRKWIAQGEKKGAIGYKTLKGNWFVVSGDVAGRGYYTKCVGRDNKLFFMNVDYDEEADAIRENTMTTMSRSFNGRP